MEWYWPHWFVIQCTRIPRVDSPTLWPEPTAQARGKTAHCTPQQAAGGKQPSPSHFVAVLLLLVPASWTRRAGRARRPRRRARAGPAVYTVARAASCTQERLLAGALRAPPPTRGESQACRACRDLSPAAARPLGPSRAQQVKRPGCYPRCRRAGKLGICGLVSLPRAAVGFVTCGRRLGTWLRKVPSLAPGPRGPRSQHLCDGAAPPRPAWKAGCPVSPLRPPARPLGGRAPTSSRAVRTGPERRTVSLGLRRPSPAVHYKREDGVGHRPRRDPRRRAPAKGRRQA